MVDGFNEHTGQVRPLLAIEHGSYDQTLSAQYGPRQSHTRCLRTKGRLVHRETGQTIEVLCRARDCVACNRLYFLRDLRDAVRLGNPDQMIMLTGLTGSWPDNQRKIKNLTRRVVRQGYTVNLVYAIETNPRSTGWHAHGWLYGCAAPGSLWSHQAEAVGLGEIVGLKPVTRSGDFGYIAKAAGWNSESLRQHLVDNGPHRVHPTRGFWRDARTGDIYGKMRDAAAAWRDLPALDRNDWAFQPRCRRRLGALTPAGAARIRALNAATTGVALVAADNDGHLVTVARPARTASTATPADGHLVLGEQVST